MKNIFILVATIAVLGSIYGLWLAGKWINYKLAYESGVQTTIKEMVKPECLRGEGQ